MFSKVQILQIEFNYHNLLNAQRDILPALYENRHSEIVRVIEINFKVYFLNSIVGQSASQEALGMHRRFYSEYERS